MSWARYDDELSMHRKVALLRAKRTPGIAALGLHLLANTWSRNQGTGGHIPSHIPDYLAGPGGTKLAQLLEAVEMFDPADDGWMMHNFDDFNDPADPDPHRSAAERRKEISAKRAVAGSVGGKQTASKRAALLAANEQQCSSPVPVPVPSEYISDNSTPENTPSGVDNSRRSQVLDAYARLALDAAKARGQVRSESGYLKSARLTASAHVDLDRWLGMFPAAPASAVAAWLCGDKHSMAYYQRADDDPDRDNELATIHHLPGATA